MVRREQRLPRNVRPRTKKNADIDDRARTALRRKSIVRLIDCMRLDFDDRLSLLRGQGSSLLDKLEPGSDAYLEMAVLLDAVRKAANLTRQLDFFDWIALQYEPEPGKRFGSRETAH